MTCRHYENFIDWGGRFLARSLEVLIDMPGQPVGVCNLKGSTCNSDRVDFRPIAEKSYFSRYHQILTQKQTSPGFVTLSQMSTFALLSLG